MTHNFQPFLISEIIRFDSSSITDHFLTNFFNELLKGLYLILLNRDFLSNETKIIEFVKKSLYENDFFDYKKLFIIMTTNNDNNYYYSSLIGLFYQHGIGCKIDKIKAFEIFSNAGKNDYYQLKEINYENIDFSNNNDDDIKNLNEIILQYLYCLYLYKNVIKLRKISYKLNIKNAESGDDVSQYYIGNCFYFGYFGNMINQDYDKAFEWYLKSSENGNIEATFQLGSCYYSGIGTNINEEKGFELYLKSANKGHKLASLSVGQCYSIGCGILKDEEKAFEWYLKAAEKGSGYCQYLVANYYYQGKYIQKNDEKSLYWYRKAAINDHSEAQRELAKYYLDHCKKKALNWYLILATKREQIEAVYMVAKCFRDGIGVKKNKLGKAEIWFNKFNYYIMIGLYTYHGELISLNDFLEGSNYFIK